MSAATEQSQSPDPRDPRPNSEIDRSKREFPLSQLRPLRQRQTALRPRQSAELRLAACKERLAWPPSYRDGAVVLEEQILGELRDGAGDAGVPLEAADALFAGALAGDAGYCALLEELIPVSNALPGPASGVRDP